MLKSKVLLALVALSVCGLSFADDQIDGELKKKGEEKVRTFSVVDAKAGVEKVYAVSEDIAKELPKGDQKDLSAEAQTKLEKAIESITSKDPINETKISKDEETATAAHHRYCRYYRTHYPRYYYPNYYYGGGFYYQNYHQYEYQYDYSYRTVWNYHGHYHYPRRGRCYWGW